MKWNRIESYVLCVLYITYRYQDDDDDDDEYNDRNNRNKYTSNIR